MTHYNEEVEQPEKVEDIMFRLNLRKGDKFTNICPPRKKPTEAIHQIKEFDMSMDAIKERAKQIKNEL
jgi:hypothetical protein